jgi:hypothetical protein
MHLNEVANELSNRLTRFACAMKTTGGAFERASGDALNHSQDRNHYLPQLTDTTVPVPA